ncbi:MAG: hypothetical protein KUG74_08360 [Rhodobacteraceae bacterium]|nr:hypothetical protein [Paracoccaceae bacterium]
MLQTLKHIKRSNLAFIGLMGFLGGCVAAEVLPFQAKPVETTIVNVNGARIAIGGPPGFCINNRQSHTSAEGAFVALGPCNPEQTGSSEIRGLLVANVSPDAAFSKAMDPATLQTFFKSTAGRKSLSNSGDAETVDILDTISSNDVFFVHSLDSSDPLIPDTTSESWRGFFPVSGRMVSVSMINFIENPISGSIVFNQLESFSTRIIQLNSEDS